jgi:hypothetical protein
MLYRPTLWPTGRLVGQPVDFCWPTGLLELRSEQRRDLVWLCLSERASADDAKAGRFDRLLISAGMACLRWAAGHRKVVRIHFSVGATRHF